MLHLSAGTEVFARNSSLGLFCPHNRIPSSALSAIRAVISETDYNDIADEIYNLREERRKAPAEEAEKKGSKQRLEEMEKFLNEQSVLLEGYDEQLVRSLIEKITVFDDKLTVEFKSGDEIDVLSIIFVTIRMGCDTNGDII